MFGRVVRSFALNIKTPSGRYLSRSTTGNLTPSHQIPSRELYQEKSMYLGSVSRRRAPLAKIVATIGPASENNPVLSEVAAAGMKIMRINFSHATYDEANLRVTNLRLAAADRKTLSMRAIMLDTQGPEIRTGSFANVKEMDFATGDQVTLSCKEEDRNAQSKSLIWVSYQALSDTLAPGNVVLLDDGALGLEVVSRSADNVVTCKFRNSGTLGNKKGVNMPGLEVKLPAISDKDKQDLQWGVQNDIDYIAASFVRRAEDVHEIRAYVAELMQKQFPDDHATRPHPRIISKIEAIEALRNLDAIIAVSDGIMVARGDLGVEIPLETLAMAQKDIVARCRMAGKPVIVATQMLESMQKNPRPTRAECTDVANAIIDGADCVMLSGESAKGKYPVEAVDMMNGIVLQTERSSKIAGDLHGRAEPPAPIARLIDSVAYSVANQGVRGGLVSGIVITTNHLAEANEANVFPKVEELVAAVAKFRPGVPIIPLVTHEKFGRLLQMYRGVHPWLSKNGRVTAETLHSMSQLKLVAVNSFVAVVNLSRGSPHVQMQVVRTKEQLQQQKQQQEQQQQKKQDEPAEAGEGNPM